MRELIDAVKDLQGLGIIGLGFLFVVALIYHRKELFAFFIGWQKQKLAFKAEETKRWEEQREEMRRLLEFQSDRHRAERNEHAKALRDKDLECRQERLELITAYRDEAAKDREAYNKLQDRLLQEMKVDRDAWIDSLKLNTKDGEKEVV